MTYTPALEQKNEKDAYETTKAREKTPDLSHSGVIRMRIQEY